MFEKVVLRRSPNGPTITVGNIADALLYYGHVHVLIDRGTLLTLGRKLGLGGLFQLLSLDGVTCTFHEDLLCTYSEGSSRNKLHRFVGIQFAGNQQDGNWGSLPRRMAKIFEELGSSSMQARRLADRFRLKVPVRHLDSNDFIQGGVPNAAFDDLQDDHYVEAIARNEIEALAPSYRLPSGFYFRADLNRPHFKISTNLDFDDLNNYRRKDEAGAEPRTEAHIVDRILDVRSDIVLSSYYGAEYQTTSLSSTMMKLRAAELVKKQARDDQNILQFEEITFPTARRISDCIDSGERSFDDFLKLLKRANKFKEFAQRTHPDKKLISEYFDAVNRQGWLSTLPAKSLRYVATTTIGAFYPLAGALMGAGDTFFLDKLRFGWRPNHFVQEHLVPFLEGETR